MLDVKVNSVASHQLQDGRVTSGSVTSGGVAVQGVDVDVVVVELHPDLLAGLGQGVVVEGVKAAHGGREHTRVDVEVLSQVHEDSVEHHLWTIC